MDMHTKIKWTMTLKVTAAALVALLQQPWLKSQELPSLPRITSIEVVEGTVQLQWEGGQAPYALQRSTDLRGWEELTKTSQTEAGTDLSGDWQFFRVVESDGPVAGELFGQLRVAEGEFHEAFEIHRMKSIWDFHFPEGGGRSRVPAELFESLVLKLQYLNGLFNEVINFEGRLMDLPGARITRNNQQMVVTWQFEDNQLTRTYRLEMDFPYPVATPRNTINLSDPQYELTCTYSRPQPSFVTWPEIKIETVKTDEAFLYELADEAQPDWFNRVARVTRKGIRVESSYLLGIPNYQGSPAFIFKTPVLDEWSATTISGIADEPVTLTGRFSQTYAPGHHNFWEYFLFDPLLEPGLPAAVLSALEENNIHYIFMMAGPEVRDPEIYIIGNDYSIR